MISRGQGVDGLKPISIGEADKVQSWPFKEPEKTTRVDEDADARERASVQAELDRIRAKRDRQGLPTVIPKKLEEELNKPKFSRDEDFIKAQKRELEIASKMSPPGALHLPPKLEAARWKWKICDKAFERQAQFRRIHIVQVSMVALLRPEDEAFYPGTSIELSSLSQRIDTEGCHMGVLISAGLTAMDELASHGTELGNIVGFIRNAPMNHTYDISELGDSKYLVMNAGDITCDETLGQELIAGKRRVVDEGGEKSYCHVIGGAKQPSQVFSSVHW